MKVDTAGMISVASHIEEQAEKFKKMADTLNTGISSEIGASESHMAWNGPQAGIFVENFKSTVVPELDKAYSNLIACAANLREQAAKWSAFEGE